jgi:hypothetical protein
MEFSAMPPPPLPASKAVTIEDEVEWDEPSSPFMTEIGVDGTVSEKMHSAAPSRDITETFPLSPSSQLKREAAPFTICEDETSTPVNQTPTPAALPSKPVMATNVEDASELMDNTTLTTGEEANIDDTCYSTFSEIPNMDVTKFTRMGSPSKQNVLQDQVCKHRSSC